MKSCTCHNHKRQRQSIDVRPVKRRLSLVKQDERLPGIPPGLKPVQLNVRMEREMPLFMRAWQPRLIRSIKKVWAAQGKLITAALVKQMAATGDLDPGLMAEWQALYEDYFRMSDELAKLALYSVKQDDGGPYSQAMSAALLSGGDYMTNSMIESIGIDVALANELANSWLGQRQRDLSTDFIMANRLSAGRGLKSLLTIGATNSDIKLILPELVGLAPDNAASAVTRYSKAIEAGIPKANAQAQLTAYTANLRKVRAANYANTELVNGWAEGARNTVANAVTRGEIIGSRLVKRWWTALDDMVCALCEPLHGKVVGFETLWNTQLEQNLQRRLPTDQRYFSFQAPALHNGCRCEIIYEVYT